MTSKQLMTPLRPATRASLIIFLILMLACLLSSCAYHPMPFDGQWSFTNDMPPRACLEVQDVLRLKKTLDRCEYDANDEDPGE